MKIEKSEFGDKEETLDFLEQYSLTDTNPNIINLIKSRLQKGINYFPKNSLDEVESVYST